VAVNAIGDVRDPETGALVAGTRDAAEGRRLVDSARELLAGAALGRFAAPEHTTIGVVATNARLDRADAATLASLGMLGFARALSPPHTAFDGDTLFALSLGDLRADLTRLGLAAAVRRERAGLGALDRVDAISSVSGGSLAAAYYMLQGERGIAFTRREVDARFARDFQLRWLVRWFDPRNALRYWFTAFDRSD